MAATQQEECGKENVVDEKRTGSPISKRGSPISPKRGSPTPRSPTGEMSSSREKKLETKSSTQSALAKAETRNTELSALEAHLMQLNKQGL